MSKSARTFFKQLESGGGKIPALQRPARELSRLNRSRVFPPLIPERVEVEAVRFADVVDLLRQQSQNLSPHELLNALATAASLDLETSGTLLFATGLIAQRLRRIDIAATRCARAFWNHYTQGRSRYLALATSAAFHPHHSDWAHFQDGAFDALLPGIIIPKRLQRADYYTSLRSIRNVLSIDVYSGATVEPLFRHPFRDEFNPVVFGANR